jgi:hypothetical protein
MTQKALFVIGIVNLIYLGCFGSFLLAHKTPLGCTYLDCLTLWFIYSAVINRRYNKGVAMLKVLEFENAMHIVDQGKAKGWLSGAKIGWPLAFWRPRHLRL